MKDIASNLNPLSWEQATKIERMKMIPYGVLTMVKASYYLEDYISALKRVFTASAEMFYDLLTTPTIKIPTERFKNQN